MIKNKSELFDFHTHTFLSDGVLSPSEIVRRASENGYTAIGLTDHVGAGNMKSVLCKVIEECMHIMSYWDIIAIPGVEITHVPAKSIKALAKDAKGLGAKLVVVHGETIIEPIEKGTNREAIESEYVDILAHPGIITEEDARDAASKGVYLEISARQGHSFANGYIVKMADLTGAKLLINSDAHAPLDLLTKGFAEKVALSAGLNKDRLNEVLIENPKGLLKKIGYKVK